MGHKESFDVTKAINGLDACALAGYFDEGIEINSYYWKDKNVKGAKEAIIFFEDFFADYKTHTYTVLIFCRFMDEYGCTPMLDGKFKELCPSHDFFIYMKEGKIIKIEIFGSLDHSMRFYVDDDNI